MKSLLYSFLSLLIILITLTNQSHATPPDWDPPTNLQFNMQVVARLSAIDGGFSMNENDLVAAFVGDECRGLASPIADVDGFVFLTVGSNLTSGETITFKAWYSVTGQVADLNESFDFADQGEVGNFDEPFIFTIQTLYPPAIYTIVATSTGNGTLMPSGTIEVVHGSNQLYLITPDPLNHVFDVKINGESIGGFIYSYEFANLQQNSTIHVDFATGTGLGDLAAPLYASVAPNPVRDKLCLQFAPGTENALSYTITDLNGRRVQEDKMQAGQTCLDVHRLTPATYVLKLIHSNREPVSLKFVVAD
jgi:hypothetical protein